VPEDVLLLVLWGFAAGILLACELLGWDIFG
jgi:hypothetical protein